MSWALLVAGTALVLYQTWAIAIRWSHARVLAPAERRVMIGTLLATRGLGLVLGLILIIGALLGRG